MTEGLEALTTATLVRGLDAASLRQQAIAANIANANVEAYVPQRVSFGAQLEEARRAVRERGSLDSTGLAGLRFALEPALDAQGQPQAVQLDAEAAELAQNAVHYQALVKGLSRHLGILSAAVSDGKK